MNNVRLYDLIQKKEIHAKLSNSQLETYIKNEAELTHAQIIQSLESSRLYTFYLKKFIDDELPQYYDLELRIDMFVTQLAEFSLIDSLVRACNTYNVKLGVKIVGVNNSVNSKITHAQQQSIGLLQRHNIMLHPTEAQYRAA